MALLAVIVLIVAVLGILALAADRWGADTRPSIGDDHRA
jgi:hypothetical protein